MAFFRYPVLLLAFVIVNIGVGCSGPGAPIQVSKIEVQPSTTIIVNETATLTVQASGSTNLKFKWSVERGTLSDETKPSVLYTAPEEPGPDTVTVVVSSGDNSATRSQPFQVIAIPPTPTDTPSPTFTTTPTEPPTATPSPVPPSPTALPADTPTPNPSPTATPNSDLTIPTNMTRYAGKDVEIYLPSSYVGGDPSKDLPFFLERLETLGTEYTKAADFIRDNPSAIPFWAFDTQVNRLGSLTSAVILKERVFSGVTLELYMDISLKQLPSDIKILSRETMQIGKYPAGRVMAEQEVLGAQVEQLMYILKDGNTFWLVIYSTEFGEFEERLPTFEKSVRTFRPLSQ